MNRRLSWLIFGAIALLALVVRFYELDRSAVRSDEINFLNLALQKQTVSELWKNPPWMNQIPLADSISVMWHWFRPGQPDEQSVREPFALIGWLTVVGCMLWVYRRRGLGAGALAGVWLALLPFHVYQSREAYYYVVVMAFAAGLTLYSADLLARLRAREKLDRRAYIIWTAWAVVTCLTHMSTWVIAAILWLLVMLEGVTKYDAAARRRHVMHLLASAAVIAAVMFRWIWRAYLETQKVSQADGHIGAAFGWVGPRVLPFFTVGANPFGVAVSLALVLALLVWLALSFRNKNRATDPLFSSLTIIVVAGFAAAYAYIGLAGGGAAKISYFTALLPVFLVWASCLLDGLARKTPVSVARMLTFALPLIIAGLLIVPAWKIVRIDGKPVPYKLIRDWLDQNLEAGSVAVIDRWFEPWNEMARYAPTNVIVTFTVPDEPYENYERLQWRAVTQQAIESGKVNAFIRLTRNHESRAGLWRWPETYFARRGVVVNDSGLWMREHGYGVNEDFNAANTNRLVTEIFYDLREDVLARARRNGKQFQVFYGPGLPYEKSGPMGIFRFQTAQFMDWRVLESTGQLEVYNLSDTPASASILVTGVSPRGPKTVNAGGEQRFQFNGGQIQRWVIGPLTLAPGSNSITLTDPIWSRAMNPLLIQDVEVVAP